MSGLKYLLQQFQENVYLILLWKILPRRAAFSLSRIHGEHVFKSCATDLSITCGENVPCLFSSQHVFPNIRYFAALDLREL